MLVWFSVCWGQAILLLQPQYGGALIQAVQNGANAFTPLVILLVLLVANALLTMGQQALVAKIAERLARRIRGHLVHFFCLVGLGAGGSAVGLVFSAHCERC